jgi:hypothetical protein
MVLAYTLRAHMNLSLVIPDGSRKRSDPGPMYPGVRKKTETGIHGSRLSRLKALGRDDKRESLPGAYL